MNKNVYLIAIGFSILTACGAPKNKKTEVAKESSQPVVEEVVVEEEVLEVVEPAVYRETETVLTDLIHTKLEVRFDWAKSQMKGLATITAKPHFYATDSLILDAKSMQINAVKMDGKDLTFSYANDFLRIHLGRTFTRNQQYTIVVDYIARPEERKEGGSAAITSDKGLFFINPTGEDKTKMTHLWTQGETEASSVWFPTIDSPNAKTSQEIFMTVQDKYVTLSNGKFMGSKKNADGTRTDHWKQDLPHAPYLFMMAVGEFAVVKDEFVRADGTKMPVHYYVEKEWEQYARDIFGETPAMIRFFSDLLKVEYPWDKYHQIIVRDYVSGAMENTGAVIFGEYAYKTKRELLDNNDNSTIAHELFHHWFGDLVTAESWSNLTLNESFANYSQYLWDEHRHGLDEADYQAQKEAEGYFASAQQQGYHNLVWFDYDDKEQMFDGHSYNKGGRILHMLRNYLGDEAFFEGISQYLKKNSFKAAEFHNLRLALEEVSGKDLNWFFNQWYLASGHPVLDVEQAFDPEKKELTVTVKQSQNLEDFPLFKLPIDVAVFDANGKKVHRIWVDQVENSFTFPVVGDLKGFIFDNQQMLLAKVRETKSMEQWVYQYYQGERFAARQAALMNGVKDGNAISDKMILDALNDPFWKIRTMAIEKCKNLSEENKVKALQIVKNLAVQDADSYVRSAAVNYISSNEKGAELITLLQSVIEKDQSYMVIGSALKGFANEDPEKAMMAAKKLESENSSKMLSGICGVYGKYGGKDQVDFMRSALTGGKITGFDQLGAMNAFTLLNSRLDVKDISGSVETYEKLAENGGYYTKMFLPKNIDYLLRGLNEKTQELQAAIEEDTANNDVALADAKRKELKEIEVLVERLSSLATQEETEE
ncbi:MAG: M1 family metallopeptidase [Crocinitomicaceae bacterium]|nr:M1 family metallopeptidase [Crocinitomicaceae bacterium]